MKARDIMDGAVVTISEKATVLEASRLMQEQNIEVLVVESRRPTHVYGILSATDIVAKVGVCGFDLEAIRVSQIMTKPCITVTPNLEVEYVAWLLVNSGVHHIPVVDGTLLGIVSIVDVLHKSNLTEQPWCISIQDEILIALEQIGRVCCERGIMVAECAAAWNLIGRILCKSTE